MRLLHTADWHIGRRLHGFDLMQEQKNAFNQIEQAALAENVDGVIIAGDLYDRSLPSEDSVALLNQMIRQLNLKDKLPIYAISGNHDSATRLATGAEWFKETNYYMHTNLAEAFTPIELPDTQLFLLPYFEPFAAKQYFENDDIHDVATAFQYIVNEIKKHFDPKKRHVLVAHFFAAGSHHTASETQLTVGGLNAVPIDLLDSFDYVALGHLHGKDALHKNNAQYSGSPVKFSLSEANQEKGMFIVDTLKPDERKFIPIVPVHDVKLLENSFDELIKPSFYDQINRDDFLGITLTDEEPIPNVLAQLREIYPKVVSLGRSDGYHPTIDFQGENGKKLQRKDPLQLLNDFYQQVAKEPLSQEQLKWAKTSLNRVKKEED